MSESLTTKLDSIEQQLKSIKRAPSVPPFREGETQTEPFGEEELCEEVERLKVDKMRLVE